MFFTSTLVPSVSVPTGRIDTLASTRIEPSSILTSDTPIDLEDRSQLAHVRPGLLRAANVRVAHDLHQRDAGAVVVDERVRRVVDPATSADVLGLAGVLFHVGALDADPGAVDLHPTLDADRRVVLADLVVLRHVRVEVVLPVEDRLRWHVEVHRFPESQRELHHPAVQHRQRARKTEADRADVRVRLGPELVRAAAEELGRRRQLDVHLEPDHRFVLRHRARLPNHDQRLSHDLARSGPLPDRARRSRQWRHPRLPGRGRRRPPAAARARVPGDEAHLVAQHDAARRRRLRGDRTRPARPRRVEPRTGRLLRHRRVLEGSLHADARRAGPRALLRGGWRRRRPGDLRPQPALPGLRQEALLLQHRGAAPARRVRGRRHRPRPAAGGDDPPRTTSSVRRTTPKGCSRSSTPRNAVVPTWPTCTGTGSGRRAVHSPRPRSNS